MFDEVEEVDTGAGEVEGFKWGSIWSFGSD